MLILNSLPHLHDDLGEAQQLWATVAELWLVGIEPKWPRLYDGLRRLRLRLPSYPWDHGRYWLGVRDAQTLEEHEYVAAQSYPAPEVTPPRNSYEAEMVEIFRALFGIDDVGIYHNFFHLGGDSLLGVQLARRIRDHFGVQIPLRAIWEIRTGADVAHLVARTLEADGGDAESAEAAEAAEAAPAELVGAAGHATAELAGAPA
jgi:acyl carrier protein